MVSNHISYADPVIMGVTCNTAPVTFIAKSELFDKSLLGRWVKAVGCIPIPRHSGSPKPLKQALKRLKNGHVLGIFPEGTRSKDGQLKDAEPGVGLLAFKANVPIVPMYIWGTDKALPIGHYHLIRAKVSAKVGKPIFVTEGQMPNDRKEVYKDVGKKIMKAIAGIRDEKA